MATRIRLQDSKQYAIGWLAALPIERAAATVMLDERHDMPAKFQQHPRDDNSYTWGRIGRHNIVIASLTAGMYGTTSAASTATSLLMSLPHIEIGLLVGIAGGIARPHAGQDIRLGDVVVSKPDDMWNGVIAYDLGKEVVGQGWQRTGCLRPPPRVLLDAASSMEASRSRDQSRMPDFIIEMVERYPKMGVSSPGKPNYLYQGTGNDRLFSPTYNHTGGLTCRECGPSQHVHRSDRHSTAPEVHYGIIGSGNTLVKDAVARDKIIDRSGADVLCVEMEAAGVMNHFPSLVVRGICDYADTHKNDRWQRYASATAAAYAKELLSYL